MLRLPFTKLPGQKWNADSVHQDRTNGRHDSVNQLLFKNQPAGIWGRETKHFHKEDKTEKKKKIKKTRKTKTETETGLCLERYDLSPDLNMGRPRVIFGWSGTIPEVVDRLIIWAEGRQMKCAQSLTKTTEALSYPAAAPELTLRQISRLRFWRRWNIIS